MEARSSFEDPQLRDPLTVAISFMKEPSRFRRCSHFTASCWTQAIYLEGDLPCARVLRVESTELRQLTSTTEAAPILTELISTRLSVGPGFYQLERSHIPSLQVIEKKDHLPASCRVRTVTVKSMPDLRRIHGDHASKNNGKSSSTSGFLSSYYIRHAVLMDLPELDHVDDRFLFKCRHLESVQIVNVPKLHSLGVRFAAGCCDLTDLILHDLPQLTALEDFSLSDCGALHSLHLVNLPRLCKIGDYVATNKAANGQTGKAGSRWMSLKEVKLVNLPELTATGVNFLSECARLDRVTFEHVPKLSILGRSFLQNARGEQVVDQLLSPRGAPALQTIGGCFLKNNARIVRLSLSGLQELEAIHEQFLAECGTLTHASIHSLPKLAAIEEGCFRGCPKLEEVLIGPDLPKLSRLAPGLAEPGTRFTYYSELYLGKEDASEAKIFRRLQIGPGVPLLKNADFLMSTHAYPRRIINEDVLVWVNDHAQPSVNW